MSDSLRASLLIALKDLRRRLRDRSAIVVAVVAPFGLAAIFSLVIPDDDGSLNLRFAYADLDRSEVSMQLRAGPLAGIEEAGIVEVTQVESDAAARAAVAAGDAHAAIVVPSGFAEAVQAGQGAEIDVVGALDAPLATEIARSVVAGFTAEVEAVRLAVIASLEGNGPPDPDAARQIAERAVAAATPVQLVDDPTAQRTVTTSTYFAAAMAIFFLFFTAQFGVLSLLSERRAGTLPRLVAAPIGPWSIIVGKALGSFALGLLAMTVLVVASSLLLGAEWGNPLAVAALVVAAVLAAMGITAAITTLARTEEQAGGWNAIVAVSLAMLGGAFFPVSQGPEILALLSRITPHAWFLDGLNRLAVPGAGIAEVAGPVLALLAFGAIAGSIGLARAERLVVAR